MAQATELLSTLPNDALTHVVSFLSSKDALKMQELNSSFQSNTLSLSTLHNPAPLINHPLFYPHNGESNTPLRAAWIPVMFPHRTHSVVVTCYWQLEDYGLDGVDGCLYVVAVPAENDPDEATLESMENGKIVYESPLAPHQEESLTFSFSYSPSLSYYVWYRIGGGDANQLPPGISYLLYVKDFSMHTIVHDYSGGKKWIGEYYQALSSQGLLENHHALMTPNVLAIHVANGQEQMTPEIATQLASLLGYDDFDTSLHSLKALDEIAAALQVVDNRKKHETRPAAGPFGPSSAENDMTSFNREDLENLRAEILAAQADLEQTRARVEAREAEGSIVDVPEAAGGIDVNMLIQSSGTMFETALAQVNAALEHQLVIDLLANELRRRRNNDGEDEENETSGAE